MVLCTVLGLFKLSHWFQLISEPCLNGKRHGKSHPLIGDWDESAACSHMLRCHISEFHPPNWNTIMLRISICFVVNIGRQKENRVRAQELITDNRGGLLSRYRTS